ncbi:MAG: hypothetical protein HKN42_02130 [Granulosicoccus sp.]|nr:hypothetical protein [Granulosicoccus sp.]
MQRIDAIPLFIHAYTFHLNLRFGRMDAFDLLDFADRRNLHGIKVHIDDGEERSLRTMTRPERLRFGQRARDLGLAVHVEVSSTDLPTLSETVEIAHDTGAQSLRSYPRYEGPVSEVIRRTIDDLKRLPGLDSTDSLLFTLEQHEDLKSHELVYILDQAKVPRLSLLFDFGNMINAFELPDHALDVMASHITEVHIKDVRIVEDRGGRGHLACRSGEGDINFPRLLFRLLLLGKDRAQVTAFALEEEVGLFAPAFRFPDEGKDPFIPYRSPSETEIQQGQSLQDLLQQERADADRQILYVRAVLEKMHRLAELHLASQ